MQTKPEEANKNLQPSKKTLSKGAAGLILITVYGITFVAIFFIIKGLASPLNGNVLLASLIANIIGAAIVFIFSVIFQNSSIFDPYWGAAPIIITIYWEQDSPNPGNAKNIVAIITVLFFCCRHMYLLAKVFTGFEYEDFRYKEFQEKLKSRFVYWLFSLVNFHWFPALMVFGGIVPLYYMFYYPTIVSSSAVYYIGLAISMVAVIIEYFADEQLHHFRAKSTGKVIDEGLWRYSRHPNYLGEVSFWLGLYIAALGLDAPTKWWTGAGFVAIYGLFEGYSIPTMEKRMLAKKPEYSEIQKKVSRLWFWFRKESKYKNDQVQCIQLLILLGKQVKVFKEVYDF